MIVFKWMMIGKRAVSTRYYSMREMNKTLQSVEGNFLAEDLIEILEGKSN